MLRTLLPVSGGVTHEGDREKERAVDLSGKKNRFAIKMFDVCIQIRIKERKNLS